MSWKTSEKAFELFIIQLCCTVFVYISVGLRFWSQTVIRKKHEIHDLLMYISAFLYTAQAIIIVFGIVKGGIGQQRNNIKKADVATGFQIWYFGELIYALLSPLVKTSVAWYLFQVYIGNSSARVAVNRPLVRKGVVACLGFIWTSSTIFLFISIFQCSPVGYFWGQIQSPNSSGTCLKRIVPIAGIVLSVVLALSDFALALVPIISLRTSQLPLKIKIKIGILMSLGALAGVAMLVRTFFIKMLDPNVDFLYETVDVIVCTVIEVTLGIIAGCLPIVWPLLKPVKAVREDSIANNRNTIHCHTEFIISEYRNDQPNDHAAYNSQNYFYRAQ